MTSFIEKASTLFLEEAEKENVPIIPQKIDKNLNRTIDQSLHETLVDTLKTETDFGSNMGESVDHVQSNN